MQPWGYLFTLSISSVLIAHYAYYGWSLLLTYPHVWPDEPLFAEPAMELLGGSFGTPSLAGTLPGIEDHTLWMPPLYFLYLAIVFGVFSPNIEVMRCGSWLLAVITIGIVLWIGHRTWRLSASGVLAALAVFTLDHVWLRGSLVGRSDMLTSATTWFVIALLLYWGTEGREGLPASEAAANRDLGHCPTGDPGSIGGVKCLLLGVCAGLPVLTHPLGLVAPLSCGVGLLLLSRATAWQRLQQIGLFSIGGMLIGLPWFTYIGFHAADFAAQFGAQLGRKASRNGLADLSFAFDVNMCQYEMPAWLPVAIWTVGIVGLWRAAVQSAAGLLVFIAHALFVILTVYSCEMWYPIFAVPGTALGTGWLVHDAFRHWFESAACNSNPPKKQPLLNVLKANLGAGLTIVVLAMFAWANIGVVRQISASNDKFAAAGSSYRAWSSEIARHLPPGAVVYLCASPDPYFGLRRRGDLKLLEFLPAGLPHGEDDFARRLSKVDFVVVTEHVPDARILPYLNTEFTIVSKVGYQNGSGYVGFVCRRVADKTGL